MRYLSLDEIMSVSGGDAVVPPAGSETSSYKSYEEMKRRAEINHKFVPSYSDWAKAQSNTTTTVSGNGSAWWPWGTVGGSGSSTSTGGSTFNDYKNDVCGSCHK